MSLKEDIIRADSIVRTWLHTKTDPEMLALCEAYLEVYEFGVKPEAYVPVEEVVKLEERVDELEVEIAELKDKIARVREALDE